MHVIERETEARAASKSQEGQAEALGSVPGQCAFPDFGGPLKLSWGKDEGSGERVPQERTRHVQTTAQAHSSAHGQLWPLLTPTEPVCSSDLSRRGRVCTVAALFAQKAGGWQGGTMPHVRDPTAPLSRGARAQVTENPEGPAHLRGWLLPLPGSTLQPHQDPIFAAGSSMLTHPCHSHGDHSCSRNPHPPGSRTSEGEGHPEKCSACNTRPLGR